MKKFILLSLFAAVIMAGFTTCKKTTTITCNLAKTDTAPSDMTIVFKAEKTGDGTISTLSYQVGTVTKTVTNPTLPWTTSVQASSGDAISITATGTTADGSITVSYEGENQTDKIQGEDYCSHTNN